MFKNFEWVCLDPNHPDGGVLAIMAKPWKENAKFCPDKWCTDEKGNWNNYRTSAVRMDLTNAFADVLGDNILLHKVDLVADNGDRAYGTVQDFAFILTCDEYRKYRDYIPHYNVPVWTATPWYCGDKDSDADYACYIRYVNTDGQLGYGYADGSCSVAPACILNPKLLNLRKGMAYVEEVSE
nr:MAG TPA: hypothetical protein [Caudoviricetes sp.]